MLPVRPVLKTSRSISTKIISELLRPLPPRRPQRHPIIGKMTHPAFLPRLNNVLAAFRQQDLPFSQLKRAPPMVPRTRMRFYPSRPPIRVSSAPARPVDTLLAFPASEEQAPPKVTSPSSVPAARRLCLRARHSPLPSVQNLPLWCQAPSADRARGRDAFGRSVVFPVVAPAHPSLQLFRRSTFQKPVRASLEAHPQPIPAVALVAPSRLEPQAGLP